MKKILILVLLSLTLAGCAAGGSFYIGENDRYTVTDRIVV